MGKGAQGAVTSLEPRPPTETYTWEEVKKHATRTDKWLVIEGEIYDISEWHKKHPGGSRMIAHYAGQDATEAFRAFHIDENFVRKRLKHLHVGSLEAAEKQGDQHKSLKEDFENLRQTVTKLGLFKPSLSFYVTNFAHLMVFEVLAYLTLYCFGTGWLPWCISVLFFVCLQAQAGWTQHDYGHLSVCSTSWWNHFMHYLTINFAKGASRSWWNHLHYQHHGKPNVISKDPDVHVEAVFVVGEDMPKEIAKTQKKSMPYNWQHRYFFAIGPPLLYPIYFQIMIIRHPLIRKQWLELLVMLGFYFKLALLYSPFLGLWGVVKFYFMVRVLESHWFVWVTQSNHIPMEIAKDKERPWVPLQLSASCNIEKSVFNDWFTGHLNFQIEHHLFPTMPRHNLYKTTPLVKALCKKHNVPYQVKTLHGAFADIIRSLKHSGELWLHCYKQHHKTE